MRLPGLFEAVGFAELCCGEPDLDHESRPDPERFKRSPGIRILTATTRIRIARYRFRISMCLAALGRATHGATGETTMTKGTDRSAGWVDHH
jgi:hypothetical protein